MHTGNIYYLYSSLNRMHLFSIFLFSLTTNVEHSWMHFRVDFISHRAEPLLPKFDTPRKKNRIHFIYKYFYFLNRGRLDILRLCNARYRAIETSKSNQIDACSYRSLSLYTIPQTHNKTKQDTPAEVTFGPVTC